MKSWEEHNVMKFVKNCHKELAAIKFETGESIFSTDGSI